MSIIYILIPIAILLTSLGIYLFFWAVKTEQFEDLEKQGMSILFDDEPQVKTIETELELKKEEEIQSDKNSTDNK
ncbi:cbb3-type cytochrome oxidase assembly protein CcoS [Colwellia sp. 75C3]|uniref:cbb3-type cytochrome oxidase assembly protein CcoS n=1 Tax=Colwellia sp. 75C3 TaxID=888425 RepID=UPI000C322AE8|nr:cbb3-type cytochrome oxidase assembly protein CcoS [Colwellia sp. 75C3]PKG82196.1 cbb3-type cytochrome oxidase assembly protein CcoS [Colwellia sp. 75C3]